MHIDFYTWDNCPDKYKGLAGYTKYFFEGGGKVTRVAVMVNANLDIKKFFRNHPNHHTDEASLWDGDDKLTVLFWTSEEKR